MYRVNIISSSVVPMDSFDFEEYHPLQTWLRWVDNVDPYASYEVWKMNSDGEMEQVE